jgi:hypothetical protein
VLFGQLCTGRHSANIATISKEYVPWEECFLCARKIDLPILLRTFYTNVLMNSFVDVDPNRDVLSEVQLNYEWETVGTDAESAADDNREQSISGAIFPHFKVVHEWIVDTLKRNEVMFYDSGSSTKRAGTAQQQNQYLTTVLKLLHMLIIFGYYTNLADIDSVQCSFFWSKHYARGCYPITYLSNVHSISYCCHHKSCQNTEGTGTFD